jgi:hypothetical protein
MGNEMGDQRQDGGSREEKRGGLHTDRDRPGQIKEKAGKRGMKDRKRKEKRSGEVIFRTKHMKRNEEWREMICDQERNEQ